MLNSYTHSSDHYFNPRLNKRFTISIQEEDSERDLLTVSTNIPKYKLQDHYSHERLLKYTAF